MFKWMLDLEFNVKKLVCTWTPGKTKLLSQTKLTFHQKCGQRKENKQLFISNVEFVHGLLVKEHMNLGRLEMTKMLS